MKLKMRIVLGIAALAIGGGFTYPAFTQVPDGGDSPFPEGFGMRRIDPRTGELRDRLEMPSGIVVSGLESNGSDLFFCGGSTSGTVRAGRPPSRRAAKS